ncbi:MAG TPA: methyltransferase [Gaiellaceae bacterium]|jgi:23S rRNA G2445 N2-methylase RlmL|nr:methyltransferase [Gaiellaceae bacterium]
MHDLVARTVRGIEDVAARELAALGTVTDVRRREVRFRATLAGALAAGTVDDVFLELLRLDPPGSRRALAAAVAQVDLDAAAGTIGARGRSFDVTVSLEGRSYARAAAEDAVGAAIAATDGWRYRSRRAANTLSLRLVLDRTHAWLGVRVARAPLHRRLWRVASRPGALHPPLARALVRLADPPEGARLGDPFCGTGTIAIEAKLARPDLRVVCSDTDPGAVAAARANAAAAGVELELAVAEACGSAPVDVAVTNPPWGRAVAPREDRWEPSGRAVLLLAEGLRPPGGATVLDRRWLRVSGRPAVCWTVERPG